ncbi:hypothetical protein BDZ94DRAFT_1307841 [Collybia nuda]|uniref:DUF6697 domain-containing protein n=1 Tax=Collybia nuda TaxID=64659 RepID=A0A9P6CJR6_9AGAR|nr:hypothetical protein BDZ94DRAFT_1307841 [Collybia nuda]
MPDIPLDVSFAPELVEFWGKRYKEVKDEIEQLKKSHIEELEGERRAKERLQAENILRLLQDPGNGTINPADTLLTQPPASNNEERELSQKLILAEKETELLRARLSTAEALNNLHQMQLENFYSQTIALAREVEQNRMSIIMRKFPPTKFVDDTFQPQQFGLATNDIQKVLSVLPNNYKSRKVFSSRIVSRATSGYWFYPNFTFPAVSLELVTEISAHKWAYMDSYVSDLLPGYEMKLAEWMTLDEATKLTICTRIANQGLPPDHPVTYPIQFNIKRQYETGERLIPCFSLRCVGFDMNFHYSLDLAVEQARPTVSKVISLQTESDPNLDSDLNVSSSAVAGGKRQRPNSAKSSKTSTETSTPGKKAKIL